MTYRSSKPRRIGAKIYALQNLPGTAWRHLGRSQFEARNIELVY